jgi:hypothetical protein
MQSRKLFHLLSLFPLFTVLGVSSPRVSKSLASQCTPLLTRGLLTQKQAPDDVRDAFIVTRKKGGAVLVTRPPGSTGARVPIKPRKPAGAGRIGSAPSISGMGSRMGPGLGLGYTLFQQDANGRPVRVSAAREFRQGDAVRLVVESNADGFLYIFHTENDGPPRMIFPDSRLHGGRNAVGAHVPYEVPSSRETDAALRWFRFDDKPAAERLFLVFTKTRLPDVPVGPALVAECRNLMTPCPWRPADAAWHRIARIPAGELESKTGEFGQLLVQAEVKAIERGMGLGLEAPGPAVIRMSKSPGARELMSVVELIHK